MKHELPGNIRLFSILALAALTSSSALASPAANPACAPYSPPPVDRKKEKKYVEIACKQHLSYSEFNSTPQCRAAASRPLPANANEGMRNDKQYSAVFIAVSGRMNSLAAKNKEACQKLVENYVYLGEALKSTEVEVGKRLSAVPAAPAGGGDKAAFEHLRDLHERNRKEGACYETKLAGLLEKFRENRKKIEEMKRAYGSLNTAFRNKRFVNCWPDKSHIDMRAERLQKDVANLDALYEDADDSILAARKRNVERTAASARAKQEAEARLARIAGASESPVEKLEGEPELAREDAGTGPRPAADPATPPPALDHTNGKRLTREDYLKADEYKKSIGAEIPNRAEHAAQWGRVPASYSQAASTKTLEYQAAINDAYNQLYGTYGDGIGPSVTQDGVLGPRTKAATSHLRSSPAGTKALEDALRARGLIP